MKIYKIPCEWTMYGYLRVEAKNKKEAIVKAQKEAETCELPEEDYLDSSFQLNLDDDLIEVMNE